MTKSDKVIEYQMLEFCIREELNKSAQRRMAVLEPLKVTLTNYPEGETEWLDAVNNPEDPDGGSRQVPFSRTLYIEQADFMEDAPKKFFRLSIGREVRLRWAYFITCTDMVKDADGNVIELLCTYDPATKGGDAPDGRKVKGTLHWVSADHAVDAEIRNYDHLYTRPDPGAEGDPMDDLNPDSLSIATAKLEPSLTEIPVGETIQFERQGYYCVDPDSTTDKPVFNKTTGLRDSWAKAQKTA
jgi:glutaminyl-tRNA synthetase